MSGDRIEFAGSDGQKLVGRLTLPAGKPKAFALFAHCFTCTKNILAAVNIARALADRGFGVLRFDFTGLGESEGDFADTNFSSNVADLVAAARFLADRYAAPKMLIGHSLGGTAVLQAAARIDSAVAVATIGAPAHASHVRHLLAGSADEIETAGEAEVKLAGRPFRIRKQFLDDIEAQPLPATLRTLRRALLVMHSPVDEIVGIDNAGEIFQNALHPKSFVSLDTADHLLTREADSHYAAGVLAAWAARYLPADADAPATLGAAEDEVIARTETGYTTTLDAGGHIMLADEPATVGGANRGPSPYGYLAAALAACTSMTLRMYADHKKLPLESVTVSVRGNRIHAKDCDDCESTEGFVHVFDRVVEVAGPLSEEQRQRMLEIADKCPVHRTLEGEVRVRSRPGGGVS